jgi:TPR repeat protein
MYRDGRGVHQDKQVALQLLNHKVVEKDADACFLHASILLENVQGSSKGTKNRPKAIRLLKFAASQNHADSQYLLACQLQSGDLKKKNCITQGRQQK